MVLSSRPAVYVSGPGVGKGLPAAAARLVSVEADAVDARGSS
jgi:hypothetical protein